MNWEYLKDNKCPHCGQALRENVLEFKCTRCTFTISPERKLSIEEHRAHPERSIVKLKWQNLRDERCPICSKALNYTTGIFEILACMDSGCSFKIRHDRFLEILNDETHPCNRFYEREKLKTHGITEE